jgi:hypothetical protein
MTDRMQFSWRWVWCVLGVLVAGCSGTNAPGAASATAYPTLVGYTRWPPTAQGPLRLVKTPTLAVAPNATFGPLALAVGPPDCYEAATGAFRCLGLVRNVLTYAVDGISLRVSLIDSGGAALDQQDVPIARLLLWPDDEAPYGALFDAMPDRFAGASVELIRAARLTDDSRATRLKASYDGEALIIENPLPHDAATIHAVVTLFDMDGRVIGFRALESTAPLLPNSARRIPFVVASMNGAPAARLHAAADGIIIGGPLTPAPTG